MKKYCYCSVLPKGMKNTYYYIADEETKVNAFVQFPFGYENTLVIGTVMEVGFLAIYPHQSYNESNESLEVLL